MLSDQQIAEKATTETITTLKWWNDRLLTFTTTRPPNYSFVAGQYARLGLHDANGVIWRAYSMVSAPHQDVLEFYGVIVPGGLFTTQLKQLQPGNGILVEKQSYGFMTPDRFSDGEDLWMFATGTGVGPYISMLRNGYVWKKFRNLVLVYCVRHADEFGYRQELENLACKHSPNARLHLVYSTTRDLMPSTGSATSLLTLHGRVTMLLENGTLEKTVSLPITETGSRIMMCGNPAMIEDMRRLLHQRGMRPMRRALPGQFVTENYW